MSQQRRKKTKGFNPKPIVGSDKDEYLLNKNKGGDNFEKGRDYEIHFAVGRLAELVDIYLTKGKELKAQSQKPGFFVDDLVIDYSTKKRKAWQLKDVAKLSWGSGTRKGTIGFDFYNQIHNNPGKKEELALVVSSKRLCEKLEKDKPTVLQSCEVEFFPNSTLLDLIREGHLFSPLSKIARSSSPSHALLKEIANLLIARWREQNGQIKTSELLPINGYPNLLRTAHPEAKAKGILQQQVKTILDAIPGFKYEIDRGFFHCSYLETTRQTLGFDCFSQKFKTVQDWIVENKPTVFEGPFERMLNTWSDDL